MKKIGFIGYGHMASSMLEILLSQKTFKASQIIISETQEMVDILSKEPKNSGLTIVADNKYAAKNSDILFLCVKPLALPEVLSEIKELLDAEKHHIISIAACVEIGIIERFFKGKITRTLPTVVLKSGYGTTFVTHSKTVSLSATIEIETILRSIGDITIINEEDYASAVNITSSAPGILACIFDIYSQSTIKDSSIPKNQADNMLLKTIFGTIKMVVEKNISFTELTEIVSTKGGITEAAVNIIRKKLPPVFDSAIAATILKDKELKNLISEKLK